MISNFLNHHSQHLPAGVEYLLYMDAYDSMLMNDAGNVVKDFLSYDAEMLIIGTNANWPNTSPWRHLFEWVMELIKLSLAMAKPLFSLQEIRELRLPLVQIPPAPIRGRLHGLSG